MVRVDKHLVVRYQGEPEAPLLEEALSVLNDGGVVALPTDTVYGLAARPDIPKAIDRVYRLKGRGRGKPLVLLTGDTDRAMELAEDPPECLRPLARRFWPGPLTLVVKASGKVRGWGLDSRGTVGIRISPEPAVGKILEAIESPLASTSANRSGEPECHSAAEVLASLREPPDLLLDGGQRPRRKPSTVLDITGSRPMLLRKGEVSPEQIEEACGQRPALSQAKVLFVCTGNTCRSPMADGLFRHRMPTTWRGRVEARSCGTGALPGMPATGTAKQAARKKGFDISGHRSQPLSLDLLDWADLVVAMEQKHLQAVRELSPGADPVLMAPGGVSDPLGGGLDEYLETIDLLESHLPNIYRRIARMLGEEEK